VNQLIQPILVIANEAKQSSAGAGRRGINHEQRGGAGGWRCESQSIAEGLDCFASFAMTVEEIECLFYHVALGTEIKPRENCTARLRD
jgi:hypothetical protein